MQSVLLARLISLVAEDHVKAPLFDPATINDSSMTNQVYIKQYIANLLTTAFPHIQP
jgi:exportin-1